MRVTIPPDLLDIRQVPSHRSRCCVANNETYNTFAISERNKGLAQTRVSGTTVFEGRLLRVIVQKTYTPVHDSLNQSRLDKSITHISSIDPNPYLVVDPMDSLNTHSSEKESPASMVYVFIGTDCCCIKSKNSYLTVFTRAPSRNNLNCMSTPVWCMCLRKKTKIVTRTIFTCTRDTNAQVLHEDGHRLRELCSTTHGTRDQERRSTLGDQLPP